MLALLRDEVRDQKATFLVIDGFVMLGAMSESEIATKKFIHELQVLRNLSGAQREASRPTFDRRARVRFRFHHAAPLLEEDC